MVGNIFIRKDRYWRGVWVLLGIGRPRRPWCLSITWPPLYDHAHLIAPKLRYNTLWDGDHGYRLDLWSWMQWEKSTTIYTCHLSYDYRLDTILMDGLSINSRGSEGEILCSDSYSTVNFHLSTLPGEYSGHLQNIINRFPWLKTLRMWVLFQTFYTVGNNGQCIH